MTLKNHTIPYIHSIITLSVMMLCPMHVYSSEHHLLSDISKVAHDFLLTKIDTSAEEVQIVVGQLDPRLSLHKCSIPLLASSQGYETRNGKGTVRVSCNDQKPWSLYVPVTIKNFREVAVLRQGVTRNTLLTHDDIVFEKMNINRLTAGYFDSIESIQGKILTQNLSKGAVLTKHHLKAPMAINRGQLVTLIAKNSVVEVRTEGKALSKGAIGERIKVKNMKTQRIVEGVIIDKHLINVNL